jgi:hypothetical protein
MDPFFKPDKQTNASDALPALYSFFDGKIVGNFFLVRIFKIYFSNKISKNTWYRPALLPEMEPLWFYL